MQKVTLDKTLHIAYTINIELGIPQPVLSHLSNECVNQIKASEEMGGKYMQKWEEEHLLREEVFEEATFMHLQNLMTNLHIPMEEALAILGVPKEDREKYLQLNS